MMPSSASRGSIGSPKSDQTPEVGLVFLRDSFTNSAMRYVGFGVLQGFLDLSFRPRTTKVVVHMFDDLEK